MNDMGGKSVNDKDSREIDDIIKRLRESVGEGRPKPHGRGYSSGSFEQKLAELLEKHLNEKRFRRAQGRQSRVCRRRP